MGASVPRSPGPRLALAREYGASLRTVGARLAGARSADACPLTPRASPL